MTHTATEKTRTRVETLSGYGATHEEIAEILNITKPTLRKYYRKELDCGLVRANTRVANSFFRMATDKSKPNVAAAIFWMKARAGWRDQDINIEKQITAAKEAAAGAFALMALPKLMPPPKLVVVGGHKG